MSITSSQLFQGGGRAGLGVRASFNSLFIIDLELGECNAAAQTVIDKKGFINRLSPPQLQTTRGWDTLSAMRRM